MIRPSLKRLLFATTIALLITGCSSSSGPCQTKFNGYSCGDCLIPNNISFLCQGYTLTSSQQSACESSCGSTEDQAALTSLFACTNKIPGMVGTCSAGNETGWVVSVVTAIGNCSGSSPDAGPVSLGCLTGFLGSFLDGG
jgi:hypothetical protein